MLHLLAQAAKFPRRGRSEGVTSKPNLFSVKSHRSEVVSNATAGCALAVAEGVRREQLEIGPAHPQVRPQGGGGGRRRNSASGRVRKLQELVDVQFKVPAELTRLACRGLACRGFTCSGVNKGVDIEAGTFHIHVHVRGGRTQGKKNKNIITNKLLRCERYNVFKSKNTTSAMG